MALRTYTLTLRFEGDYASEDDAMDAFGQIAAESVGADWRTHTSVCTACGRATCDCTTVRAINGKFGGTEFTATEGK